MKDMPLDPANTGKGELCAPVSDGVTQDRYWILVFEDQDRENVIINDEDQAREIFAKSESQGWNCHLFGQVLRNKSQNESLKNENDKLRLAINEMATTVENWSFGWDGDCGVSTAIEFIREDALDD
jgi:hypothetical protein